MVKLFPGPRKLIFPFYSNIYVISSEIPGEIITRNFIACFSTSYRLLSVPSKIPSLPSEKAFLNGTCPINVKSMYDIKEVMKYIDHHHKDFWTSILAWDTTSKENWDKLNIGPKTREVV
jgi:hypothetical protein